jgi:hypothetical protein
MPKLKVPLPLAGGINTQADPSAHPDQLRNARNAFYKRDDMTLRRRPDITLIVGAATSTLATMTGCTQFENTDRTFKKFVAARDTDIEEALVATDVESPGALTQIGSAVRIGSPQYRKPVQYNNVLYWPSMPSVAFDNAPNPPFAWDGTTAGTRDAGVDGSILRDATTFTINVGGAGTLTFTTGRVYTFTLVDTATGTESMPSNNGSVLDTVTTGAITNKGPVVTVTWLGGLDPNNGNTNNNHDAMNFYATTDGGTTYYFHSQVAITDPDLDGSVVTFTDSTTDAVLATGAILVYNSIPPPARFFAKFQNKLVAGGTKTTNAFGGVGEDVQANVLYYSLPDEPEHWPRNLVFNTSINAIPFRDQEGDELMGAIQVNRVLLVGLRNSIWSINNLPIVSIDPFFDVDTLKDRVVNTHGFVSAHCYTSLQLTDDEDAAFYVSHKGFHLNNGSVDRLVSESIRWDSTVYNADAMDTIHVVNDSQNYICIVGFPSVDSDTVDSAYVYHYHPSHLTDGMGKITGPWDYNLGCSCLVRRNDGSYEVWGTAQNPSQSQHSLVKVAGTTGTDFNDVPVAFEWETGWLRGSDDLSTRIREFNCVVQEADASSLTLGTSSLPQTVPKARFLQTNSCGFTLKIIWNDDAVTLKTITGSGDELLEDIGTLPFVSTDRALVSASLDCEAYGEEKTLDDGTGIAS